MLKAIIVDDEEIFLIYLKTLIDFESYGVSIAGEAKNGREALALCDAQHIDIAFVDISMPQMDGLEFAALAKAKNPNIEIILITGHSEFEYARKAMQLGVHNYILKPFEKSELIEVVEAVTSKIQLRSREATEKYKHTRFATKYYLEYLISGGYILLQTEIDELIRAQFGQPFKYGAFVIIDAELSDKQVGENWGELDLWHSAIINILSEILASHRIEHFAFDSKEGHIVCLLLLEEDDNMIIHYLNEVAENINKYLHFSITCSVGSSFQHIEKAAESYVLTKKIMENKFIMPNDSVLTQDMIGDESGQFHPIIDDQQLLDALRTNDTTGLKQYLASFFKEIQEQAIDKDVAYAICVSMINSCLNHLSQLGFTVAQVYGSDFQPFANLKKLNSIVEYRDYVLEIYHGATDFMSNRKFTRSSQLAFEAKKIIENEFANNELSTQYIANQLFIDSSYLRAVFKKEFQDNVTNCILITRLMKARELILDSSLKLSAIAFMVGFSDGAYFSKCFKKHFGISPSKFYNLNR